MGIEVQDLSELDPEAVQQSAEFITELTQEEHPDLEVRQGVLADILILPAAQHAAATQLEIDRTRRSNSLKAIEDDPTLADDDIVDATISNYRITRREGVQATGEVTIVVSKLSSVTIPNGAVFEGSGKEFETTAAYVARTSSENIQSDTDRVLNPVGDGTFSFTIDIVAVEEGTASQLEKDTALTPTSQIVNFVKAFAASDFVGGQDTETNSELLLDVQNGLSVEALSGRANMSALLFRHFPDVINASIIGFGDAEMFRDQRSLFPLSFGGRVDWYVRSRELPQQLGLTKTATLIEKTVDNRGIWQFGIARDEAPGFYDVKQIAPLSDPVAGSYDIVQEVRSIDITPIAGELLPDVVGLVEGNYSRYVATVVQFRDTDTDTSTMSEGTTTQDYSVTVRAMPSIAEIQTLVSSRSNRNYAGDVLVRAPVPCFVSMAFTLEAKPGEPIPDAFAIQDAIAKYINRLGFTGRISASAISDIVHGFLTSNIAISAIDMNAQILRPDGSIRSLRSSETLIIPDESANIVTARTVGFYCDPQDVLISARSVNIPEI